ncbi:hypothetical protein BH23GEM4_BH23GEM4_13630 [soil metagenome]
MKRLAVLGTLVWDRIHRHPGRPPHEGWGGIAYSLAALGSALPDPWQIVPFVRVCRDLRGPAEALVASLPKLAPDGAPVWVSHPTNRVELRYPDPEQRCERLTGGVGPWTRPELLPRLVGAHALYVNFISGADVTLHALEGARRVFRGPIYADLHSLLLSLGRDGRRSLRPLPEWRRWLACCDAVQVNEEELATLAGGGDLERFSACLLSAGPGWLFVTRGSGGAEWWRRRGVRAEPTRWEETRGGAAGAAVRGRLLAEPVADADPTGCGDVWGATLFARLLARDGIHAAGRVASRAAAGNARRSGVEALAESLAAIR